MYWVVQFMIELFLILSTLIFVYFIKNSLLLLMLMEINMFMVFYLLSVKGGIFVFFFLMLSALMSAIGCSLLNYNRINQILSFTNY